MCPCNYISEDDALEVTTRNAIKIEENIKAVLIQVLENSERPRNIGAAITEKHGFLDAFHTGATNSLIANYQGAWQKS